MGIFQPGGPGTQIHVYNDADNTNHPAAPGAHTWAEINTAFPVDFPKLQSAAGGTFSATHVQYLCEVDLMFGLPAGGSSVTSLTDTTGADIFSPAGGGGTSRLRFTTNNTFDLQTITLGTKIGTGVRMTGKQGGTIHAIGNLLFRANLFFYGCFLDGAAQIQFLNGSGNTMEFAGCGIFAGGSFLIGSIGANPIRAYNTIFSSGSPASFATVCALTDASNLVWGCTAPGQFYLSAVPGRTFNNILLSGAPTQADFRITGGGSNDLINVTYSDTAGIPKVRVDAALADAFEDFRTFDVKVVDQTGNPISGIPIFVTNDKDGSVLSAATNADGNVVFTNNPIAVDQVLKVRRYGGTGAALTIEDRVFTTYVNTQMDEGVFPHNPNYGNRQVTFEWPGRDRQGTGYSTDAGSFKPVLDVIVLSPNVGAVWTECEIFP